MRPGKNIGKLIKKLHITPSAKMHQKTLHDVLKAQEEFQKENSDGSRLHTGRIIMKINMKKLTVAAAVVIVAVLIGMEIFGGKSEKPEKEIVNQQDISHRETPVQNEPETEIRLEAEKLEMEFDNIDLMLAAGNVDGLVATLSGSSYETKVAAANYLAEMNSEEVLNVLEKLNAEYDEDDPYNPFALAVEKSKNRLEYLAEESTTKTQIVETDSSNQGEFREQLIKDLINKRVKSTTAGSSESSDGVSVEWSETNTGPTLTDGISGSAYYFDGSGDFIDIGYIDGLGAEQTKMLWMYLEDFPLGHDVYVLDEGGGQSNNNWIEIFDSDSNGIPSIRAGFDAGNYFDSDGEVQKGVWYHIAVVTTSSGVVETYIDGVLDSWNSGFSAVTEPNAIVLGIESETRNGFFKGVIDEVAIFNRALSGAEIEKIYHNLGRPGRSESGLVGYWSFDSDEGDIVRDSSPMNNDGKLSYIDEKPSYIVLVSKPESRPELTEGILGNAYYFDGYGDYIDIGNDPSLQTEVFTMTAWIATSDIKTGWQTIVSYEQGSHAISVVDGYVHYGWQWIFVDGVKGISDVRTGEWIFVCVTRDSDNVVNIYVNGELEKTSVVNNESNFLRNANIGGDTIDGEWFNGLIDEVAIYNRALSMEEVQQLYQNPKTMTGNESGLVGYWNFDNDEGDIVKDGSPYNNHGKLVD